MEIIEKGLEVKKKNNNTEEKDPMSERHKATAAAATNYCRCHVLQSMVGDEYQGGHRAFLCAGYVVGTI